MQPSVHPLVEVEAAQAVIRDHTPLLSREVVSLGAALGRFLAEDVRAPRDLPTDPTSTVDGYALRAGEQGDLVIVGESGAGHPFRGEVPPGSAVRIMTGAIVPTGLEAVAMIEDVVEKGDRVEVSSLPSGSNIRRLGDDIRSGEMALQRGQSIGAAELGLAAALGLPRLPVHRRPKVALISTGDELVEVGSVVGPGQIIDSNRWALAAALTQSGAEVEELGSAPDDSEALRPIFEDAFTRNQVLVSSGGVSTGSHDNVKPLLAKLGHLHIGRVRLKPGMPFTFATLPEGQLAFGLPGFPVSSLVTFE
ncbi:MAG: molybdopterin molybdotransferase MoeA, partial [Candidatus Dormibacteraceae bacterium]